MAKAKNYRLTPSGKYEVYLRRKGQQFYKLFDTENAAKQFVLDIEKSIQHLQANPADRSLKNILLQYQNHDDTANLKSYPEIKIRINKILLDHELPNISMDKIVLSDLEKFRKELEQKKLAASTIHHYFSIINQAYNHAITRMRLPIVNIVGQVKLPKIKNQRDRVMSEKEYEEFKKVLPEWLEAIVSFAYFTAARQGEILKLRFMDIDFDKRTAKLLDTKNGEDRTIPLSKRAYAIVEGHKKLAEEAGTYKPENRVFQGTKDSVSGGFRYFVKKAELLDLRFHDLRHSAITLFLAPKVPSVLMLQKITGHKTLSQLSRYYNAKPEDFVEMLD